MITDRFIEIPIKVFDLKHRELTGKEVTNKQSGYINPYAIEGYREAYDEDKEECIQVFMKSGETWLVYLTMKQFRARLNKVA